jgi:riboflavin synthase alpha subunit
MTPAAEGGDDVNLEVDVLAKYVDACSATDSA